MVKDFRLRQDLRHFLQQCHCDAGGLTRQTLLNRTHWASPSNAPSLGLRTAMELRALLLLLLCFPALQAQTPHAEEGLSEGSSLSIQCPYTAQADYHQQKAWCHRRGGQCEPLVETIYPTQYPRTNRVTNGKVTIEDNPMYETVSITMTNLQVEDSGTYFCAYRSHHYKYLPLKIISLNVFKELHKWELDSLSVQCKYSASVHSTDRKAWCRRGRTGCEIWLMTDNLSTWTKSKDLEDKTLIQDDAQKRTVTITMKKLQAQDAGVYWCVLYRGSSPTQKTEIRLSVSKILAGTTLSGTASTSQATPSSNTPAPSSNVNTFILLSGVLSILFILALTSLITLCVKRRKQLKRRGNRQAEDIYDKPEDIAQLDSTERMESPKDDSKDVKYITLNFKSRLSPEDPLYCNVEPSQAHRKSKDENVEYATIALKQLPTNDKG
ncbi:polymeric immunoglobulin receptor-like isoform X6 [Aquila chrysaetos chrysaetos]|uniref:polymeric immunoglobulin receptor-like isoform X6 n=1 Tax=Aquila chrysaetos chrysaetos TaxID=223781 RepID=UPI001B7D2D9C|nr:polymeric immunoglobulin receptor-like isoform X6 [Aquila chrysaetos chrysaetos]